MLVLFSVVKPEAAVNKALNLAKENEGQLYVVLYLEKEIPSTLSSIMKDTGYMGEKVQTEVKATIKDQYVTRVKVLRRESRQRAEKEGIDLTFDIIKKASMTECYRLIEENEIDYLVINYTDDQYIAQVVADHFREDFLKDLTIPYQLYLDGERVCD